MGEKLNDNGMLEILRLQSLLVYLYFFRDYSGPLVSHPADIAHYMHIVFQKPLDEITQAIVSTPEN